MADNKWYLTNHDPEQWIMKFEQSGKIKVNPNYPYVGQTSDGYHTFDELYAHRIALFKALCIQMYHFEQSDATFIWKSKTHSDGSVWDGWFVAGLFTEPGRQITYHIPIAEWDTWPGVEREKAPEWDGHTPVDVLERLRTL